jgi:hypothetical protein
MARAMERRDAGLAGKELGVDARYKARVSITVGQQRMESQLSVLISVKGYRNVC